MNYSWILFDADDTLFDFGQSAKYAFYKTLEIFEIRQDPAHFGIYKQINEQAWLAFENNEINVTELRRVRFERFLDAIGEYRDPLEMNGYYLTEIANTAFMVEGAVHLVTELLSKNHRLGLITNGLKEVQRPRLAKARMESCFEVVVVSDEIGVSKPDAGFFEHTFRQMGFPEKEQVLVVGDSLNSDIRGGNDFGLDTCWFNPNGKTNITPHVPTFEIRQLEEVKKILYP